MGPVTGSETEMEGGRLRDRASGDNEWRHRPWKTQPLTQSCRDRERAFRTSGDYTTPRVHRSCLRDEFSLLYGVPQANKGKTTH
jgi:hypothetical protein